MASIAFHLMVRFARWRRARFVARLQHAACPVLGTGLQIPATLVSFCGRGDFPELVASWRSLHQHGGRPRRSILVSDGTLGDEETGLVRSLEPRTEVLSLEAFGGARATPKIRAYAAASPMGRKLIVMRSLDTVAPCLYADSDILFFKPAREIGEAAFWQDRHPSYLLDPYPSLDERLLRRPEERQAPVNGGFLVIRGPLDWDGPLERFHSMTGDPAFFSEQTLVNIAIRGAGGCPLDPDRYVLRNEDQWAATDWFSGPRVALRHYISSIRYKMWTKVPVLR